MLHATKDTFATFFSILGIFVKQKIDSELLTEGYGDLVKGIVHHFRRVSDKRLPKAIHRTILCR